MRKSKAVRGIMLLRRYDLWPRLLSEYFDSKRETPFAWGTHDCMVFAYGAVEVMHGKNPLVNLHGKYNTAKGAACILRRSYKSDIMVAISKLNKACGMPPIPAPFARRGDLLVLDYNGRTSLGVAGFNADIIVAAEIGIASVPLLKYAKLAWRV